MKLLYLMAAMMLIGLFIMVAASQKVLTGIEVNKNKQVSVQPELQPYIAASYLGITLFIVGAVGSLVALLKRMNRRF